MEGGTLFSVRASRPFAAPGEARSRGLRGHLALSFVSRLRLRITALAALGAFAILALAVSRGHQPFHFEWRAVHFERHAFDAFGPSASLDGSSQLPNLLATPAIIAVAVVSTLYGAVRRVLLRVAVYAGFAATAFVISEKLIKPLVGERYFGELSFPSGNVTAVCATAFAMWMALYPVFGRWVASSPSCWVPPGQS